MFYVLCMNCCVCCVICVLGEYIAHRKKKCMEEVFLRFYNVYNWKKNNKINFNEFILLYWKMKIKIYFFYGLPVGGTNEKK